MKARVSRRIKGSRTTYLKGGMGSMFKDAGQMRPRCWFRVQLRRGDLMSRVGRQRTQIRKGQPC